MADRRGAFRVDTRFVYPEYCSRRGKIPATGGDSPTSPLNSGKEVRPMLTRRQFLCTGFAAAGALSLAACATSAPPAPTQASAAPTAASAATGGTAQYKLDLGGYRGPAPTGQQVTIRFMRQSYTPATEAVIKGWITQWNQAYPNIVIEEETVPYGDLNQKLQTYVSAGDAPDIMMGKGDFVQAYVFNNVVLDLSDYLTDTFIQDIPPQMRAQQTADGKLYAMPWEQGHTLLYFNKDLFDKAGCSDATGDRRSDPGVDVGPGQRRVEEARRRPQP